MIRYSQLELQIISELLYCQTKQYSIQSIETKFHIIINLVLIKTNLIPFTPTNTRYNIFYSKAMTIHLK